MALFSHYSGDGTTWSLRRAGKVEKVGWAWVGKRLAGSGVPRGGRKGIPEVRGAAAVVRQALGESPELGELSRAGGAGWIWEGRRALRVGGLVAGTGAQGWAMAVRTAGKMGVSSARIKCWGTDTLALFPPEFL